MNKNLTMKEDFLSEPQVSSFIDFLATKLDFNNKTSFKWKARSGKNKTGFSKGHIWEVDSIHSAFLNYKWPAKHSYTNEDIYNYEETDKLLGSLKDELSDELLSTYSPDNLKLSELITKVLKWGGVEKNVNIAKRLRTSDVDIKRELIKSVSFLNSVDSLAKSEFNEEFNKLNNILEMDSGTTKIYSLLCNNFIILDSRVGAAICKLVVEFCKDNSINLFELSQELRFGWNVASGEKASFKIRNPNPDGVKPLIFKNFNTISNVDRVEQNIKVNWLLSEVIYRAKDCSPFKGIPQSARLRALEASLFMIGYDINFSSRVVLINEVKRTNKNRDTTKVGNGKEKKITNHDKLLSHVKKSPTSLSETFSYNNLAQLAEFVIPITTPTGKAYASLRFLQNYCSIVNGDISSFDTFKRLSNPREFFSLVELRNDWQFKLD
tara:strand:- start:333 stop:1640 length:1308 start_codon:yes stop_codon:yes gene_type:complete